MLKNNIFYVILAVILFSCGHNDLSIADKLYESGKYKEAIESYSDIIENAPRNVNAFYNRGRSYEEINNINKAESDFKKVLQLDEKNVSAMLSLAKLYYQNGQYSKALIYSQNALKINENSGDG